MAVKITVKFNVDHALITWQYDKLIPNCIGFALYRTRNNKEEVVQNRIGFADNLPPKPEAGKPMLSDAFPIQRFVWTDFSVFQGDKVKYKVVPVLVKPDKTTELSIKDSSPYSKLCTIDTGKKLQAYFNVGIVSAQFFTKLAKDEKGKKLTPKSVVTAASNDKLRTFLGGELSKKLFGLLDDLGKKGDKRKVYLALFELEQEDLVEKLIKIGDRCNLILANGAAGKSTIDKNEEARELVKESKIKLFDRMVGSGHLSHNKFMVICDTKNKPKQVWTGSTNWTPNGMFGQVNNGIFIDDAKLAEEFYKEWEKLKDAGSGYPKELADYNKTVKQGTLSKTWFNPTPKEGDLEEVRKLIDNAKEGILFLMFNPGREKTLYNRILDISQTNQQLYIRGILNQDPGSAEKKLVSLKKPIKLIDKGKQIQTDWETILPGSLKELPGWDDESSIGLVRIHSKVVVVDPFGTSPYVITGSNNMGVKASKSNDDNLNIISDSKLAEEFAVNIMSIYNHYHFRFSSKVNKSYQYKGLTKNPKWMESYLNPDRLREIAFWI